jgi:hypothetical protein
MIHLVRATVVISLVILLSSCASTRQFHQYPDVESYGSNTAFIHFIRENSAYGSAIAAPVYVDGYQIGRIGPGGHLATNVPAKKIVISSTDSSTILNAEIGKVYYFEISMPPQMWIATPGFDVYQISDRHAEKLGYK